MKSPKDAGDLGCAQRDLFTPKDAGDLGCAQRDLLRADQEKFKGRAGKQEERNTGRFPGLDFVQGGTMSA